MDLASPADGAAAHGLSPVGLGALQQALVDEVDAGRLPGAVLALWRHGQPAWQCTVGWLDAARRVPMRADALFRIFSMTKPLTSVAALQLVQRGVLALDDAVCAHLPAFGHRGITVRHLLTHTAGLAYGPRLPPGPLHEAYARQGLGVNPRAFTAPQLVRALSQVPLTARPGTRWDYGNATDLLGVLVEAVSGRRLGEQLRQQLFQPLGMPDTAFVAPPRDAARIAQPLPHDPADGSPLHQPDQTFDATEPPQLDSGGAGALSTAADYGRFVHALLSGQLADGRPLLDPALLSAMRRDQLGPMGAVAAPGPGESTLQWPGFGFGLGVAVRLDTDAAEGPGAPGSFYWPGTAGTLFWADPAQRLVAVFLSQAPGALRQQHRRRVLQLLYAALQDGARRPGGTGGSGLRGAPRYT